MTNRKESRQALALDGALRSRHDVRAVVITDLSRSGCRVQGAGLASMIGERIILRPLGLESLEGFVRWASEGVSGVEFERPLHAAVVDHLCRMHPGLKLTASLSMAA